MEDRWITQVRKGLLELCILNILRGETLYGYEIVKRLTAIPELVISEGTIYPILNRLKEEGLLTSSLQESKQGPVRKYYKPTELGLRKVDQMNAHWKELNQSLSTLIGEEK